MKITPEEIQRNDLEVPFSFSEFLACVRTLGLCSGALEVLSREESLTDYQRKGIVRILSDIDNCQEMLSSKLEKPEK